MVEYNQQPLSKIQAKNREISIFTTDGGNIDQEVVKSFGDEWLKFQYFSDEMIETCAKEYFEILGEDKLNRDSYILDIGCGSGRWTKYLAGKSKFIEAIDPSNSIFAADNLLNNLQNVRLTKAAIDSIPFDDETFDLVISVGVLHHTPDPVTAMKSCVDKVKKGGYFYCYLYHNLESKNFVFKFLFWLSEFVRKIVCRLPARLKGWVCDLLAVIIYMPFIIWVKVLVLFGLRKLAMKMPLSAYYNKSFFIIRNDSLDKFGTKLERRFSKKEIESMMIDANLEDIVISDNIPYYHAVGRRK